MEKKLRLLLAEDDSDDRDFFKEVLKEIAPEVELTTVGDGRQAVDYLTRCGNDHLPCAVIIDYNMPNMKAPEVLEWICGRSWFDSIHKFVWSTSDQPEYETGCRRKGATDYFVKPANQDGLENIIHRILEICGLAK